ncbi:MULTISPECIES: hypothetical protein [Halobacterium]|uniref:hypothetical protein n=1 Tax=Halobacterium TaxID=2239 RepID=UPI00073E5D8C|nr:MULTISPECIES: hypothetical protein [Halobacterium]MCG1003897.1 hypothetical protein [Halobacterium noricense]
MATHHIPKGVSLDTLEDIVAGWDTVGAAAEPKYTTDVADATGISDAVGRQTKFLEEVGVLDSDGQKHRLTDEGQALAGALAVDDDERASERANDLLADWAVTEAVRGIVRENPSSEDDLVPLVGAVTGQDPENGRARSGITTLLNLYDWAGLLDRDDERYVLPEDERPAEPAAAGEAGTADHERAVERAAERAAAAAEQAERAADAAGETAVRAEDAAERVAAVGETVVDAAARVERAEESVASATADVEDAAVEATEAGSESEAESEHEDVLEAELADAVESVEAGVEAAGEEVDEPAESGAESVSDLAEVADRAGLPGGRGATETAEAAVEAAEDAPETAVEAAEPTDSAAGAPAVDLALSDGTEVSIAVDEENGVEISVDGDVDLADLDVRGAGDAAEAATDDDLRTDGGAENGSDADIDVSEEDGAVTVEIGADPGITISIGGEDADGESAEASGEAEEESETADEAVERVVEESAGEAGETTDEAAGEAEETAEDEGEEVAEDAGEDGEPTAVPGEAIEALVEATEASDVESLVEDVAAAADAETDAAGDSDSGGGEHALSLEVDLDADPEDLEVLVGSIRRGLTGESEDDEQS